MTFESYTFKPNPRKTKEDNRDALSIVCIVVVFLLLYIFLFRGFLTIIIFASIIYSIIQLRINDNKKKGANRFGSLVEKFILTENLLTVGDRQFTVNETEQFEMEADDFLGKPNRFIGTSLGTENYVQFYSGGSKYLFQFQVKSVADSKLLRDIYARIK